MFTLYYTPSACSSAVHVALREANLPFTLERVDLFRKKLSDGTDYASITPKSYVPALRLDDGAVLTETAVLLQYIADLRPESALAPRSGTFERVRMQELLNFIATQLHKGFAPFFSRVASEELKASAKEQLSARLNYVSELLGEQKYLFGETFSVADAYMFYALSTFKNAAKGELTERLAGYYERLQARASVRETIAAEALPSAAAKPALEHSASAS